MNFLRMSAQLSSNAGIDDSEAKVAMTWQALLGDCIAAPLRQIKPESKSE